MASSRKGFALHLSRYIRHKSGLTVEQIAEDDGLKDPACIRASIRIVSEYREQNTVPFLNESLISMIMKNVGDAGRAINQALKAKTKDKDGRSIQDHKTHILAVREIGQLAAALQPKPQRGINVSVSQKQSAAALAGGVPVESSFLGYEERLAKIRQKVDQHNLLPPVTVGQPDDDADVEEDIQVVEAPVVVTANTSG